MVAARGDGGHRNASGFRVSYETAMAFEVKPWSKL